MTKIPDDAKTSEAYCPTCEQRQVFQVTVPWQDDRCLECGAGIFDATDETANSS